MSWQTYKTSVIKVTTLKILNSFLTSTEHLIAPEKTSLWMVLQENLRALHSDEVPANVVANLPCVPVFCDSNEDSRKMVLVKPSSVIMHGSFVADYHPYIHRIPVELSTIDVSFMQLLTKVCVKNKLEVDHMQIVLEKIFHHSRGEKLDPNAKECVKKAVDYLYSSLTALVGTSESSHGDSLARALPDTKGELKLSTTIIYYMLYCDTLSYLGSTKIDLSGTPYSHFDIIEHIHEFTTQDVDCYQNKSGRLVCP